MSTRQLLDFIKTSQPKQWARLSTQYGSQVESKFIARVVKELETQGTLAVLRHGINDLGVPFRLAYFKPASKLTEDAVVAFTKNRLSITRQVRYSTRLANEIDVVLFVNGIPVATAKLKNPLSGQNVQNGIKQYRKDRDPRDLPLSFKKRCLVHLAVDPDLVFMTTRLAGYQTDFLLFNRGRGPGIHRGAGNPDNDTGYKTSYLWEEVWAVETWMNIIERFVHLEPSDPDNPNSSEKMIFPRYHQLDCVHKVEADVHKAGAGTRYLIQHSAGSGKSNTIA